MREVYRRLKGLRPESNHQTGLRDFISESTMNLLVELARSRQWIGPPPIPLTRRITGRIRRLTAAFPVVVLSGARQVGKTTLLRHAFPNHDYVVFDPGLDVQNARAEPDLFLSNHPPPLILDEVQYAPELVAAIKRHVDELGGTRGQGRHSVRGGPAVLAYPGDGRVALESAVAIRGSDPRASGSLSILTARCSYAGRGTGVGPALVLRQHTRLACWFFGYW